MSKIKKMIIKMKYSLLTLLVAFIIGIIIYISRGLLNSSNYMFMHSDLQSQMIPVLKMFVRHLLSGQSLDYSFSYGLGGNTIPVYTNGTCFSVFNIILLLPLKLDFQAFLLVISKLAFAAFCFSELCRIVYKKNNMFTVVISCGYAYCSFNIAYYFAIIWQDGIYLLPIIVILLFRLINHKTSLWLIITYSYLFICNFYSGYVVGIFTFILFVLWLVASKNDWKEKYKLFLTYVIYVIIAIFISSIVLLPTAIVLITNDNSEASSFSKISINAFDFFKQLYIGQYVVDEEKGLVPYIYCGILPFINIPLFFINSEIKKSKKIIYGIIMFILTIFSLTTPGYMFIHAFNNPDNFGYRFGYIISFVMLLLILENIDYFKELSIKQILIIAFAYIIYFVLYFVFISKFCKLESGMNISILVVNILFILLYMLIFYYKKKIKKTFIALISLFYILELMINALYLNGMIDFSITENKMIFDYYYNEEKKLVESVGDRYTRLSMPSSITYNNSQLIGYRSVNVFSSFTNSNLRRTLRKLGYAASDLEIKDMGYTDISNMLLGVDYILVTNDLGMGLDEPYIVDKKSLPIAYMANNKIKDVTLSSNPFENMNIVLSGLLGKEIDYYYNTGSNVLINYNNVIIDSGMYNNQEVVLYYLDNPNNEYGYIEFLDELGESDYCYFDMQDSYMYSNSPIVTDSLDGYRNNFDTSYISMPHIVNMAHYDNKSFGYVVLDEKTTPEYYFNKAYFYGEKSEDFEDIYNGLLNNAMEVDVFEDGYVSGKVVSFDNNNILFTSIPFDNNWNIYIDGEKYKSISLLDDSFLAVEVPNGEHFIEFKYKDKWLRRGAIMSLIGIFIFILLVCNKYRRRLDIGDLQDENNPKNNI